MIFCRFFITTAETPWLNGKHGKTAGPLTDRVMMMNPKLSADASHEICSSLFSGLEKKEEKNKSSSEG